MIKMIKIRNQTIKNQKIKNQMIIRMIKNQMIIMMTKSQMIKRMIRNQMIIKINQMRVKNNFKSLAHKSAIGYVISIMKNYFLKCSGCYNSLSYRYSISLPLILSNLNLNVQDNDSTLTQLSFGVFILSLVALLCLINIIAYIVGYYLINNGEYEIKYPKLSRFITFYKKSTVFFLGLEILMCVTCLLILIIFSLLYVYAGINNR
jgi:hypothetical protein